MIKQLKNVIAIQISDATPDSPFYESLQAQLESAERAIHVIESN